MAQRDLRVSVMGPRRARVAQFPGRRRTVIPPSPGLCVGCRALLSVGDRQLTHARVLAIKISQVVGRGDAWLVERRELQTVRGALCV